MTFNSTEAAKHALHALIAAQVLRMDAQENGPAVLDDEAFDQALRGLAAVAGSQQHGLMSLGITNWGLPESAQIWLLLEHLAGRNPGPHSGARRFMDRYYRLRAHHGETIDDRCGTTTGATSVRVVGRNPADIERAVAILRAARLDIDIEPEF